MFMGIYASHEIASSSTILPAISEKAQRQSVSTSFNQPSGNQTPHYDTVYCSALAAAKKAADARRRRKIRRQSSPLAASNDDNDLINRAVFNSSEADDDNNFRHQHDFLKLELFQHQVGGHSLLLLADAETVCKPLIKHEYLFYRQQPPSCLVPYLAEFKGTMRVKFQRTLDGKVEFFASDVKNQHLKNTIKFAKKPPEQTLSKFSSSFPKTNFALSALKDLKAWSLHCMQKTLAKLESQKTNVEDFILLENVTSNYRIPCIIDLKMGIQQYGDDADDAKQRSKTVKCASTTSATIGVRACGMQTYQPGNGHTYVTCDKYFGRTLDVNGLQQLLGNFLFDGKRLRCELIPSFVHKLSELCAVIEKLDGFRFFSSSLLLIYEGAPEEGSSFPINVSVKMIDFAHTTMPQSDISNCFRIDRAGVSEGEMRSTTKDGIVHHAGPDAGYVFGLRNLIIMLSQLGPAEHVV